MWNFLITLYLNTVRIDQKALLAEEQFLILHMCKSTFEVQIKYSSLQFHCKYLDTVEQLCAIKKL